MPKVTISDLFAKIGQLTMENEALRAENAALVGLQQGMANLMTDPEEEDVPSEVPSTVPGPDDNAGLV